MRKHTVRAGAAALILAVAAPAALATWSIVIVNTRTQEVGVGSATCLTNFDLQFWLPVVRPNFGAAAAQSFVDQSGANRVVIWRELANGTDPAVILQMLAAQDSGHQTRQYGIVDTLGRAITFTGSQAGRYANGLTGRDGEWVYAIQGNVITGQPVLDAAEMALLSTPGGMPEKLMAAMEAARAMGGDGRCSCLSGPPDSCGSPPPNFTKAAHIAFMIVSRRGDTLGVCGRTTGCANGTYYMDFNVANQGSNDPDPVLQLRPLFNSWRTGLIGVPDAAESLQTVVPPVLVNDGASQATLTVEVRDWQGNPAVGISNLLVEHAGGDSVVTIGNVIDLGNGVYAVTLTATTTSGLDRIRTTVQHPGGSTILIPLQPVRVTVRGDLNGDGTLNAFDIEPFTLALFDRPEYERRFPGLPAVLLGDMNADGNLDAFDIQGFIDALFGP